MVVKLQEVGKSYSDGVGTVDILRSLNLEIEKPGSYAIMGPSGCGKSTLISMMAGLVSPSLGSIEILEQNLSELSANDLNLFRALKIGIIFQAFHLIDHFTAEENAALPLFLNNRPRPIGEAVTALERVGLGHRLKHFPDQLSRGECQRVAIARVMVSQPEIVLADEPTGSLDSQTGERIMDLLLEVVRENKITLVFVTHDETLAWRCDKIYRLQSGALSQIK